MNESEKDGKGEKTRVCMYVCLRACVCKRERERENKRKKFTRLDGERKEEKIFERDKSLINKR